MGWITEPNSKDGSTDTHKCPLPTLAWKNGLREVKGVYPDVGSVWQCDECETYYMSKLDRVKDFYNPYEYWKCRKWVPVRWYHIGAQRKITDYVRKES